MTPDANRQQPRYAAPEAVARRVEQYGGACKNLGLLLDKFVPLPAIGDGKHQAAWMLPARPGNEQRGRPGQPDGNEWFRGALRPNERQDEALWRARHQRWQAVAQAAGAEMFTATLAWRIVIGLGGQTVMETDLTLDHLTGLPIIPGSALKGLTRAYAEQEEQPGEEASASEQEAFKQFVEGIFGVQDRAGTVIFFDAHPVPPGGPGPKPLFAVDIMNPHYPEYYRDGGRTAPSNDQSPVPVYFLTVAGATFEFAVGLRSGVDEQATRRAGRGEQDHILALTWLKRALQGYGVGGKTGAGYGFFKSDQAEGETSGSASQAAQLEDPHKPQLTLDQVEAWRRGKPFLGGKVLEVTDQGVIVQISDEENAPRGFIVGQRLAPGMPVPPRKVIGVHEWQGEWFVKISL